MILASVSAFAAAIRGQQFFTRSDSALSSAIWLRSMDH